MAHPFIRKPAAVQKLTFHDGALPYFSFPHLDEAGIVNAVTTKYFSKILCAVHYLFWLTIWNGVV